MMKKSGQQDEGTRQSGNEKPVSLTPLSFDEALERLLQVKPEPKAKKPAPKKKR
jgi:hypothetical protein